MRPRAGRRRAGLPGHQPRDVAADGGGRPRSDAAAATRGRDPGRHRTGLRIKQFAQAGPRAYHRCGLARVDDPRPAIEALAGEIRNAMKEAPGNDEPPAASHARRGRRCRRCRAAAGLAASPSRYAAWARATPPGAEVAAVYVTITGGPKRGPTCRSEHRARGDDAAACSDGSGRRGRCDPSRRHRRSRGQDRHAGAARARTSC